MQISLIKKYNEFVLPLMISNLSKYKQELKDLIKLGDHLNNSIQFECFPKKFEEVVTSKITKKEFDEYIKTIPPFKSKYQEWYSEALVIVKLLLPDRLLNFISLYEKSKSRKEIKYGNYVIEDYLQGLSVTKPVLGATQRS